MFPAFMNGSTYVLQRAFDPEAFIATVERERVTHMMVVPAQIIAVLSSKAFAPERLASLQCLLSLGAPLPVEWKERLNRLLPGRFYELYGLTEGFVTILDRDDAQRKAGSVGVPPPFYEMRIVAEDGRDLPAHAVGEIVGRGPITMPGYYARPEQTAAALRDGWLYTGDLGYVDEDGYLYLVDRKKDMIDTGGVKVYPKDVEEVAARHPDVREVAVFGIAARTLGRDAGGGRGAPRGREHRRGRAARLDQRAGGGALPARRARAGHGGLSAQRGRQDLEARDARGVLGRARPEDLARSLRVSIARRESRETPGRARAGRRAPPCPRAPRHGRPAPVPPARPAPSRASGRSLPRDSRRASRCPTSAAAGRSARTSVSMTGRSSARPSPRRGFGDEPRELAGGLGMRRDRREVRRPAAEVARRDARLRAVVDHDCKAGWRSSTRASRGRCRGSTSASNTRLQRDHRLERRRERRPREPVVVGDVLHHRAQADEAGFPREPRDRLGRIRGIEVDPADDARDERRRARKVEQEPRLGDRRRGLHEDGSRDAVAREDRGEVLRAEIAVDRRERRREPAVVAAVEAPEVLVGVDCGGGAPPRSSAFTPAPARRRAAGPRRRGRATAPGGIGRGEQPRRCAPPRRA